MNKTAFRIITGMIYLIFSYVYPTEVNSATDNTSPSSLHIESDYPILFAPYGPPEGTHPVAAPAHLFVQQAAPLLKNLGLEIFLQAKDIKSTSRPYLKPSSLLKGSTFPSVYEAVAAGRDSGGLDASITIPIQSGHDYSGIYIGGLPFGLKPLAFLNYMYNAGGLSLQQEIYDQQYQNNIVVLPVALTAEPAAGYFPSAIPDPKQLNISPSSALRQLCNKPWVVRWQKIAIGGWQKACEAVGVKTTNIGQNTKCNDAQKPCPSSANPSRVKVKNLTFGGFVPGVAPHKMLLNGNIDGYELNLPATDVHFIKLVSGQKHLENKNADLTKAMSQARYLYRGAWQQRFTYIELIINRDKWQSLTPQQRQLIQVSAKASVLNTLTVSMIQQNEALKILQNNGAVIKDWPPEILALIKKHTALYLDAHAEALYKEGKGNFKKVYKHMKAFQETSKEYSLFSEMNIADY